MHSAGSLRVIRKFVRFRTRKIAFVIVHYVRLSDNDRLAAQLDLIARAQLAAAHGAFFAIDQHLALRDTDLRLAAGGYQICELQQGVELDKFGFNRDFSHLHATSQAGPDR